MNLANVMNRGRWTSEIRERFKDRPHSWAVGFDEGGDCFPAGWYAEGLDARGWKITAPVYHEYGPFDTSKEAEMYALAVHNSYESGDDFICALNGPCR
jgi:hypothetical protein